MARARPSTFQILAGVMEATSGVADIFGRPAREMRSQTGYLTQTFSLYPDLTVDENIRYSGDLRRIEPQAILDRGQQYLRMFDMHRFADRLAGKLSGGMRQKLSLICALVPQPRILLLDEPTTGVDPVSRREFWDVLAHLSSEGLTILVATPYLDEAERCHRIGFMHQGTDSPHRHVRRSCARPLTQSASSCARRTCARRSAFSPPSPAPAKRSSTCSASATASTCSSAIPTRCSSGSPKSCPARESPSTRCASINRRWKTPSSPRLRALGQSADTAEFPARHDHSDLRGEVAIGATDLIKEFGEFTAVKNVSLQIRNGEVYGLLGANGAGKTTIIRMLCGLLDPTAGAVHLAGAQQDLRSEAVRKRIGYMSQKFSLYDDLTIRQNLDFFAGVYGVPDEEREEKIRWVLSFSGLDGRQDQVTGSLPGGWKQRVAFGAAIMHEPEILFLDEPTSGVDPLARRAFWTMINRLADGGAAVLVTTHYLEEAEQCNRLGMMVAGELVAEGTPSGIKARQSGHLIQFIVDQPQRAVDLLKRNGESWRVSLFGTRLHLITEDAPEIAIRETTQRLEENGLRVLSAREDRFSLEDVFISIVEKARLEGKVAIEK